MANQLHNGIRNILFDLGGVLLDLDFEAPVKAFFELGGDGSRIDYLRTHSLPLITGFETGAVSAGEFRQQMRSYFPGQDLSDERIDQAWCSMLLSVPADKIDFLKMLRGSFRLFLFSNTNEIHMRHFKARFEEEHGIPVESLFERCFYSHLIGDRKPNLSGFRKVSQLAGIEPGETLFVDDFIQNIMAAREAGFETFHFRPGSLLEDLLALPGMQTE